MSLKVLLAFTTHPAATGNFIERSLRRIADVHHFDLMRLPDSNVLRVRIPFGTTARAAARAVGAKPDLLIEVDGAGRRHLRNPGDMAVPTILYAIDSHRTYKREYLRRIALDMDFCFVAQKQDAPAFQGPATKAEWLPLACEPTVHRDKGVAREVDIGYVGSLDASRHGARMSGLKLLQRNYKVEAKQGVYGEDLATVYSRSKVVFNRSIDGDLNMRVFEGMSCGACVVTDRIGNGQTELFRDREHLVEYDEWNMMDTVDEVLADNELRNRVAASGQALVRREHTYDHRVARILEAAGFRGEADELRSMAREVAAR